MKEDKKTKKLPGFFSKLISGIKKDTNENNSVDFEVK